MTDTVTALYDLEIALANCRDRANDVFNISPSRSRAEYETGDLVDVLEDWKRRIERVRVTMAQEVGPNGERPLGENE